jgi:hypothetical protein
MPDSPRWCAKCRAYGDHHTDRHNSSAKARIAELEAAIRSGAKPTADARGELARLRRQEGLG